MKQTLNIEAFLGCIYASASVGVSSWKLKCFVP